MDSRDLADIIKNHSRIIIPDFGAFLLKDSGSEGFNPENITFSSFLKYNDGMLEEYIAKKKGFTKEETIKQIKTLVDNIKEHLTTKGYYTIDTLGKLMRDNRGNIIFTTNTDTTTFENNQLDSSPKKAEKTSKSTPKGTNLLEVDKEKTEETKIPIDLESPSVSPTNADIDNTILELDNNDEKKEREAIPPETKTDHQLNVEKDIDQKPQKMQHSNKKKAKILLPLIFLLASLTVIFVLAYIIRDVAFSPVQESPISPSEKTEKVEKQPVKLDDNKAPKDEIDKAFDEMNENKEAETATTESEKVEVEKAIEESVIENASIKNNLGKNVHLIVGSFKEKANAEKYVNQLKTDGYNASLIVRSNGIYSVSVGSYSNKVEAETAKKGLLSKFPKIWIMSN